MLFHQNNNYPKIPNKGRTSNKLCAPLFWRNKVNWKMGAHQIKSARELFDVHPILLRVLY